MTEQQRTDTVNDDSPSAVETIVSAIKTVILWVLSWLKAHILLLSLLALGVIGVLEYAGVKTGIPRQLAPYTVYLAIGVAGGFYPAQALLDWIIEKRSEFLHDLDPESGAVAGWQITPETWEDLTVYTTDELDDGTEVEREVDKNELWNVPVKDGMGWECLSYDPERNRAEVTYMGEMTPQDIRKKQSNIDKITGRLSTLADRAVDIIGDARHIARDAAAREINEQMRIAEGVRLQDGNSVRSSIESAIRASEMAERDYIDVSSTPVSGDNGSVGAHESEGGEGDE